MKFINFIALVFVCITVIRYSIVEGFNLEFVEWRYITEEGTSLENRPVTLKLSSKVVRMKESLYTTNEDSDDFQMYTIYKEHTANKDHITVNCPLFISFYEKVNVGIYTCQDEDNELIFLHHHSVTRNVYNNEKKTITCKGLQGIVEGKEVKIQCQVTPLGTNKQQITMGWIQGIHRTTQDHDINTEININQTLTGFYSGAGIFFYCFSKVDQENAITVCYTSTLKVYRQLEVNIITLESNKVGKHCFKCQVSCANIGEKVYNWTLNGLVELPNKEDKQKEGKICFNNLSAGSHIVKCLVSANAQISSDVEEFTVKDEMTIEKLNNTEEVDKSNPLMIPLMAMTVTIIIFGVVIFILIYLLKKSGKQQAVIHNQSIHGISNTPTNAEMMYYTIDNEAQNEYVITDTAMKTNREAETNKKKDENNDNSATPHYFVLES